MLQGKFFSYLSRMRLINRWGLMRCTKTENLAEHTLETVYLAHALGSIRNRRLGGNVDLGKLMMFALYHDVSEILTGDLPTPVKYYNSDITIAYKQLEKQAKHRLFDMLPEDMRPDFTAVTDEPTEPYCTLLSAADKLSALIKCIEEQKTGNGEFNSAKAALERTLKDMQLPEADIFMDEYLPAFGMNIDQLV